MSPAHLSRGITRFDATTLVIGSMIGSGIFIVSAESARVLGAPGWLLATWANATGLKTGTRTQNVFTAAKFAALLALTVLGLVLGRGASFTGEGLFWAVSPAGVPLAGLALVAALGTAMVGPLFSQSAWNN